MSQARIRLPATIKKGDVFEVKTLITHIMESGQRREADGKLVPRRIIKQFACSYNGQEVIRADWFAAISANPYFSFYLRAAESGTLEFTWLDDDGSVYRQTQTITVA